MYTCAVVAGIATQMSKVINTFSVNFDLESTPKQ